MDINPELLEKIKNENVEFKKLFDEHAQLKHKVEELNKLKFLTTDQEIEKKKNQKQKLKTKDRLVEILHEYQSELN